jgi:UDP-glucose 4-epimerase
MINILVTGGAGFIASHVVDRFVGAGHRVVVVDNLSTGRKENLNPRAKFYKADIRGKEIRRIIRDHKIQVISHHAAQIDLRYSVASPVCDAEINILGSINLCEAAVGTGVRTIIFSSTGGAIYGEIAGRMADESHPLNPLSPYGIAKLSVEKYLYFYKHVYGIDHVILRYANVYGPRQNSRGEAGVVAIFTGAMLGGRSPVINGTGRQTRDYCYVGDIADANLLALRCKGSDIFNVGTGIETDVNAVWRHLKRLTGYRGKTVRGPAKEGEQMRSVLNCAKLRKTAGWKPKTDLESGLAQTVEWFRASV